MEDEPRASFGGVSADEKFSLSNQRTINQQVHIDQPLSPDLIWLQVGRIEASQGFRQSLRMVRFLRHVVKAALANAEGDLKETSVGVSVYDRDPTYDPKIDPVVRNEARRLRQKLEQYYEGEGDGDPVVIELPKGGYCPSFQFANKIIASQAVVPVSEGRSESLAQSEKVSAAVETEGRNSDRRSIIAFYGRGSFRFIWVTATLVAVLISLVWMRGRHQKGSEQLSFSATAAPFTSLAGQASEPSLSVDGNLAFVFGDKPGTTHIYVMQQGGNPLQITSGSGYDLRPAWSPDGHEIAFLRCKGKAADVMSIAVPGGTERKLFSLHSPYLIDLTSDLIDNLGSPGPAWQQDGKAIIVADQGEAGRGLALYEHSLVTGSIRQLTFPHGDTRDSWPRISPDGRELLFIRNLTNSASDLFLTPLAGGETRRLTSEHADIRGASWLGNGQQVLFSSNRSGYHSLWILDRSRNLIRPLPAPGESATDPATTVSGEMAVYTDSSVGTNAYLISMDANKEPRLSEFASASGRTNSAQFSPDGSQVAFTSDRSGSWEIWVAESDGGQPRQLTHFNGPMVGTPHWSPDGRSLVFDARPQGFSSLFVASVDTGTVKRLNHNSYEERQPYWSHNGNWIYFLSTRSGHDALWKQTLDDQKAVPVCEVDALDPQESADGHWLYFTSGGTGFFRVSTAGGASEAIDGLTNLQPHRLWQLTPNGILFIDPVSKPDVLQLYDFSSQKMHQLANLPLPASGDTPSLSVSPDMKHLIISVKDRSASNIVLLAGIHRN